MVDRLITFPGQFSGFRVTSLGDRIISFRVDEMWADSVKDLVSCKIGTEFSVALIDVTSETVHDEVPKDLEQRMRGKMHALISLLAEARGKKAEEMKEELKFELKKSMTIKSSTKELDVKGLVLANNLLEKWISETQEAD